ncbi:MAG: hypothetical protein L0J73_12800 [Halomonas sp.]|nr:hypothetical protein [Halomonas sp.]
MIGRLAPWALMVAAALSAALYVQHVNGDRDNLRDALDDARQESALWQQQYDWQRAQAERLTGALDKRAQVLGRIERGVRESRHALDRLGEQNADIQDWLDRPVPAGIADWLRILQQPGTGAAVPDDTGTANAATESPER